MIEPLSNYRKSKSEKIKRVINLNKVESSEEQELIKEAYAHFKLGNLNYEKQSDLAFKHYAKAGEIFCKLYYTKDASQCYAMICQIQGMELQKKLDLKTSELNFSIYNIFQGQKEINLTNSEYMKLLMVLFKSRLYLARLIRPYNTESSLIMFRSAIECVLPRDILLEIESLILSENCQIPYLLSFRLSQIIETLESAFKFIDTRRNIESKEIDITQLFAYEFDTILREVAGIFSQSKPHPYSLILYECHFQIRVKILKSIENLHLTYYSIMADLFEALNQRQYACLFIFESSKKLKDPKRMIKSLRMAILFGTITFTITVSHNV